MGKCEKENLRIKNTLTELNRENTPGEIEKYESVVVVGKRKRVNLGVMLGKKTEGHLSA